jgi:hypothetical protein
MRVFLMEEIKVQRKGRGNLAPKDPKQGWVDTTVEEVLSHCEMTREIIKETNDQVHQSELFEEETVLDQLKNGKVIYTPTILFRGVVGSEVCPLCGATYEDGMGSLSRKDNETVICSDCGNEEALGEFFNEKK